MYYLLPGPITTQKVWHMQRALHHSCVCIPCVGVYKECPGNIKVAAVAKILSTLTPLTMDTNAISSH